MNCVECGVELKPGAKVCENCGALAPGRAGLELTPTKPPAGRTMLDHRLTGCLVPETGGPLMRLAGTTRIGRTTDNDLVLDDPRLSRHHATITHNESGYRLIDQKSMNGTFLNKRRVTRSRPLREGDHIRLGDTCLVFRWLPLATELQSPVTDAPQAPVMPASSLTDSHPPGLQTRAAQETPPSLLLAMILLGLTAALLVMAIAATVTYLMIENW